MSDSVQSAAAPPSAPDPAAGQARRRGLLLGALALLALLSVLGALAAGTVPIGAAEFWRLLAGGADALHETVVWELRAPRVATAFVVGAMLALAGVHMQVLLRNPLADPYVLGVSGGAAVGALTAMLAGRTSLVSVGAAAGALVSMLLVFAVAHGRGTWSATRLLLTGVVVAAGWGALIGFLLVVSPDANLRGMLFWLMGDIGHAAPSSWSLAVLATAVLISMALARELNVLAHGELKARALGVAVTPLRLALYFLGSVTTAAAVTLAGSVGFVGLVVPHIVRLLGAGDHRVLIPAAVLLGGTLLVLADTLARTLLAPQQLPVGVVTAFVGVPIFLMLLHRGTSVSRP